MYWQIERVGVVGSKDKDIARVNNEWLAQGWEPFAVTTDVRIGPSVGKGVTIWLRRERQQPAAQPYQQSPAGPPPPQAY